MGTLALGLWMLLIATIIGLWLVGFGLIVRGVQQYLLAKPALIYRPLIGRGAALALVGSGVAEIMGVVTR